MSHFSDAADWYVPIVDLGATVGLAVGSAVGSAEIAETGLTY